MSDHHHKETFVTKYIFSQDHKMISKQYLITGIVMGCIGVFMSMLFRLQLAYPEQSFSIIEAFLGRAGEGGVMGTEDRDLIAPVVEAFRATGMQITGPASADTMFHAAARQRYDAAIAMYHDQALIPIKTLDFDKGVNVTLGLPFIRTSPDHGTAFDIAGKGIANPSSLIEALKMADRLGDNRS